MGNKIIIGLMSTALVFPTLGNFAQAEEQPNSDNGQVNLQTQDTQTEEMVETGDVDEQKDSQANLTEHPEETPTETPEDTSTELVGIPDSSSEPNLDESVRSSENNDEVETSGDSLQEIISDNTVEVKSEGEIERENSTSVQTLSDQGVVTQGDTTYYLNSLGEIIYSEVYSGATLTNIQEYYPNSTMENASTNIKYIYNINLEGNIISSAKLDQQSQAVTNRYEYYSGTIYDGEQANKIKYSIDINHEGYVTKAAKRENETQQILSWYEYYPKTTYGTHYKKIKYRIDLDDEGFVKKASQRENGTTRTVAWFEYYPGTTYGTHYKHIKYRIDLDSNGYVKKASQRKNGTSRTITWFEYYPGTTYGTHYKHIKYRIDLDANGNVKKASQRKNGSSRTITWFEYYPGTKYGVHYKHIKYRIDLNANGYVRRAQKRENGSTRTLSWYEYYSGTTYGTHYKHILYKIDLDSSGYVREATKRENGSQRVLVWYDYSPKTTYGSHASNISGRKLNVPLVGQLPELPTGCEITAVTMMLNYKGLNLDKVQLANEMPKHPWDPSLGYVGNPFTKRGWTVYPSALRGLVKKYAGDVEILTGKSNSYIESQLRGGTPVVVWVSPMHGFSVHALTLTGYDQSHYYFNDPWTAEKDVKMTKSKFNKIWKNQGKKAISY
jgi:uncharacterized protein YvpB